jgi:hypothetical protein
MTRSMIAGSRKVMDCVTASVVVATTMLICPTPTVAQARGALEIAVVGGPSIYDLSGTGTALAIGPQLPWYPGKPFVVESGIIFFTYSSQFETRTSYLMPELSLQVQGHLKRVRPFIGMGAGVAFGISGPDQTDLTLHATAGIRAEVGGAWGLRGELRVRSIDPWVGTTADFLLGVSRRLR